MVVREDGGWAALEVRTLASRTYIQEILSSAKGAEMSESKSGHASDLARPEHDKSPVPEAQQPGMPYRPTARDLEVYACIRQLMEGEVAPEPDELKEEK